MAAPVGGCPLPEVLPDWREIRTAARAWRPAACPERGVWIRATLGCLDGGSRHFFFRLPADYSPPAPLLLYLHGGVSREALPDTGDGDFPEGFLTQWATDRGMIVVVPTAQSRATWWDEVGARHLLDILRALKSRLAVDHERVFVTGFSDGGGCCWFLAQFQPTDFAAFLPKCGHPGCDNWGEPKRQAYFVNLRNRPVYAINNGQDGLYPVERIRQYLLPAWEAGADLRFISHPDLGHNPDYWEQVDERDRMGDLLDRTTRDPMRPRITLEGADPVRCDWLEILEVGAGGRFPGAWTDWNSRTVSDRVVVGFMPNNTYEGRGCRVSSVVDDPALPAAHIGLQAGDQITGLGDREVDSYDDFRAAIRSCQAGHPCQMEILREGKRIKLSDRLNPPQHGWLHDRGRPSLRVEASLADNRFDLRASDPGRIVLHLDPDRIDLGREVTVLLEGREILRRTVTPDAHLMLRELDLQRDPTRLMAGRLEVDLEAARTW
ncbi:MAG: PDZ domain-containing protein [bacterium]|jgi:predicted esterase|nr:PDZ domain-containing protein [bacterium]